MCIKGGGIGSENESRSVMESADGASRVAPAPGGGNTGCEEEETGMGGGRGNGTLRWLSLLDFFEMVVSMGI